MSGQTVTVLTSGVLLIVFALVGWILQRKRRDEPETQGELVMGHAEHSETRRPFRPFWLGVCLFAAIAVFFLWDEHRAHILGALPWLILLACPFIHFFMHRNHGQHTPTKRGSR